MEEHMLNPKLPLGLLILVISVLSAACPLETGDEAIKESPVSEKMNSSENLGKVNSTDFSSTERRIEACRQPYRLILGIDATQSGNPIAFQQVAEKIAKALPELTLDYCVSEVEILQFTHNGRVPQKKLQLSIPVFVSPPDELTSSDADIFGGVNQAQTDSRKDLILTAWSNHREGILQKTQEISADTIIPTISEQPRCSDIAGFLGYLSDLQSEQKQIILLITDGNETCQSDIETVTLPQNTAMSIFMLPLTEQETKSTKGLDLNFEKRKKTMQERVPQSVVAAYNGDIGRIVKESLKLSQDK